CVSMTAEIVLPRIMSSEVCPSSRIGGSAVSKMSSRVARSSPASASWNSASYALRNCSISASLKSAMRLTGSRSASFRAFETISGRSSRKARSISTRTCSAGAEPA
ncbi:MAG: hypothetical protein AVDCRST_MAG85-1870, partial [uncultured Solirubrobacteraceae bacterium]